MPGERISGRSLATPNPSAHRRSPPLATGEAHQQFSPEQVAAAFRDTGKKNSPGPDGIGPLAIACVYQWEPNRVVALIRAHIHLGVHPDRWKMARGVTVPKPGKVKYSLVKSYSHLSAELRGEMVEKVASMLVSAHSRPAAASIRDSMDAGPSDQRRMQ